MDRSDPNPTAIGLDAKGDRLIDGPKVIIALDKRYSPTHTTKYSYNGGGTVCRWVAAGKLTIPAGAYINSVDVYPTGESKAKEDSSVTVNVGTASYTKTVTVLRPKRLKGTLVKETQTSLPGLIGVRLDFNIQITDQFNAPLVGVAVDELVRRDAGVDYVNVPITVGGFITDSSGMVGDQQLQEFWTSSGWVRIWQGLWVGNWEADITEVIKADGNWSAPGAVD